MTPISALVERYFETYRTVGNVWVGVAVTSGVIELAGAFRRRSEATGRDRGSHMVLRACVIPAAVLLVFAPRILPAAEIHPPVVSVVFGIAFFAAGEALRVWSKVALGRYFTYTVQTSGDQRVIASGPYRAWRHPSYTGLMMMVIGVGAAFGNWLGLGVLILMSFVGVRYRIYVEEKALLDDLGDRYRTYAEHRKRLVPFVW